jgi:hypothetical protein
MWIKLGHIQSLKKATKKTLESIYLLNPRERERTGANDARA